MLFAIVIVQDHNRQDEGTGLGRRARYLKDVLLSNGFYLVYDNDMGAPLADGFYFTVQYPGMNDLQSTLGDYVR